MDAEVRHGIVREVGIVSRQLATTRAIQLTLLHNF
jgi:hypothetical protein